MTVSQSGYVHYGAAGEVVGVTGAPEIHFRFEREADLVRLYEPPVIADRGHNPGLGTVDDAVLRAVCGRWRSLRQAPSPDIKSVVAAARRTLATSR